jgi:lysozyme
MTKILGIDISHWQANIDFEKVKSENISFVIAKAGETWVKTSLATDDSKYARNAAECKKCGIPFGAYYYFHPKFGASDQARHFLKVVNENGGTDFPLVVDVEDNDGLPPATCANVLYSMLVYLERETGRRPIIYTRNGFWVNQYGNPAYSKDYKFWLAQYPLIDPITDPFKFTGKMAGTSPGVNPIIWQFTEKMRLPGLPTLDGNFWLGTPEEFTELTQGGSIPTQPDIPEEPEIPEIPGEPEEVYIQITANFLRLRYEPKFYAPPTLIVERGQRLLVLEEGIQSDGITWYKVGIPDEYGLATGFVSANERYSKRV